MQAAGFEPAKHYAEDLEPSPFDHSGTPATLASRDYLLIPAARTSLCSLSDGIIDVSPAEDGGRVARGSMEADEMRLGKHQLQTVNKALFEVARKQKASSAPVELPLPDFWNSVNQLTAHLEAELQETIRNEGMSAKAQLLTRQLGNVRTIVTDLTRIRLNAFTQHAVLSNLMKGGGADAAAAVQQLSVIDWERHDASERAYYQSLGHLVEKYKHDVSWKTLVNGSNGNGNATTPQSGPHEPLTAFTPQQPEKEEPSTPEKTATAPLSEEIETSWGTPDFDEEDRIREMDAFPDRATGAEPAPPVQVTVSEAMGGDLIRIRILQDLTDPIIAEDGSEITLAEGDVESCPSLIAETLIAAGLAVAAPI